MGDLIQMDGGDWQILQELYDSGLDASIACMAGAGFLVELGADGAMIDATHVSSYAEASRWLKNAALSGFRIWPEAWWRSKGRYVVEAKPKAVLDLVN